MWYVYLVQCDDRSLYAGITTDPARRLEQHNAGRGSKYVWSRRPAELVYVKSCRTKPAAQRREWALRRLDRQQKLALIAQGRAPTHA